MTLPERMVEAAARAIAALEKPEIAWENHPPSFRNYCTNDARAALTAALAVAEAEGAGLFVVPGEVRHLFGPVGERQRAEGWNSCRAATLAGRVSFYDPLTLLTQEAQDMGLYSPHPIR